MGMTLLVHFIAVVLGGVFAWGIEKAGGRISDRRMAARIKAADEDMEKNHQIITLSHKEPFFYDWSSSDVLFIPFPGEYKDDVKKYNPMFLQNAAKYWEIFECADKKCGEETENEDEKMAEKLASLLLECIEKAKKEYWTENDVADITCERIKEIVIDSRDFIAKDFTDQLKKGYIRFNGLMFGVKEIEESDDKANITLFKTDYFTNIVMNEVFNRLRKEQAIYDLNSPELVNIFYPLMTALGVDTIIQMHNRTTMLVKRSDLLANMKEKRPLWHVSMNEAISQTDYRDDDKGEAETSIDEKRCVKRGLYEELHIPSNAVVEGTVEFTDVYFLMDKCEVGIASSVKLKKSVTEKLIRFAHYGAKDSMLESKECMKTLMLTRKCIDEFIKEQDAAIMEDNSKETKGITESCRYVLTMMKCRMH